MSNVGYTPGSGKTVATDSIAAVEYQRVKIAIGSTGKTSDMRAVTPGNSLASTAAATIASSSGILFGVCAYSTATGVTNIAIRDSTSSSTGTTLWGLVLESTGTVTVAYTNRGETAWFGPQGIKFGSGLRIVRQGAAKSSVVLYYLSPTPAG